MARYMAFTAFFLFVSVCIFLFLYKAFTFFYSFEIVGEFVVIKLVSTVFFVFFIFLVLSNINSIVKWYFTKEDLSFVLSNPLSKLTLFFIRGTEAIFESSWAFILLSFPVLLAYSAATGRMGFPLLFSYLLLVPFVIIPFGIAFILVMILARILSPRIIRNTFSLLSIALIAVIVVVFRALQIEKLAQPESFAHLYEYMRFLAVPTHPLMPTTAFIEIIAYSSKEIGQTRAIDIGFLLSSAAAMIVVSCRIHDLFYLRSFSNVRTSSGKVRTKILDHLFAFLPLKTGSIVLKEIKNIQRDPKEWSQVFLVLALIVVYVYNFKLFPRDRSPLPTIFLETVLSFLNMGLISFVTAAISVRFVYPSFQIEGRPFWFLLSSPVTMKEIYWKKLLFYIFPIMVLALGLNFLSTMYISTPPFLHTLSFGFASLMSLFAPVLSLYMGTRRIDFSQTPNPYSGSGGITSMLAILTYSGIVLTLLGWSSFAIVSLLHRNLPVTGDIYLRFLVVSLAVVAGTSFFLYHLIGRTVRNLEKIEL